MRPGEDRSYRHLRGTYCDRVATQPPARDLAISRFVQMPQGSILFRWLRCLVRFFLEPCPLLPVLQSSHRRHMRHTPSTTSCFYLAYVMKPCFPLIAARVTLLSQRESGAGAIRRRVNGRCLSKRARGTFRDSQRCSAAHVAKVAVAAGSTSAVVPSLVERICDCVVTGWLCEGSPGHVGEMCCRVPLGAVATQY